MLTWLDLSGNSLQQTVPTELGGLTALSLLSLGTNQLVGTIPTEAPRSPTYCSCFLFLFAFGTFFSHFALVFF